MAQEAIHTRPAPTATTHITHMELDPFPLTVAGQSLHTALEQNLHMDQ